MGGGKVFVVSRLQSSPENGIGVFSPCRVRGRMLNFVFMDKTEKALSILMSLGNVEQTEYTKLLREKIGVELLSIFERYCREMVSEDEEEGVLNTLVHLMITGYLIRANEEEDLIAPSIQMP